MISHYRARLEWSKASQSCLAKGVHEQTRPTESTRADSTCLPNFAKRTGVELLEGSSRVNWHRVAFSGRSSAPRPSLKLTNLFWAIQCTSPIPQTHQVREGFQVPQAEVLCQSAAYQQVVFEAPGSIRKEARVLLCCLAQAVAAA